MRILAVVFLVTACDGTADLQGDPLPTSATGGGGTAAIPNGDTGSGGASGAGGGAVIVEPPPDAGSSTPDSGNSLDAGARDAGTPDAGSHGLPDAGQTAHDAGTPSLCTGAAFALCDGFEGTTYDHTLWAGKQIDTGNSIAPDATHVKRGERALKIHLAHGNGDDTAQLYGKTVFPKLKDTMYGRIFIYLEADPPAHNMSLVTGHQLTPNQGTYGDNINVTAWYAVQWNQSPHVDEGFSSATHLKLNQWMCLEFMYAGHDGETRTWVDSIELTDLHETGWVPVKFEQFDLGIYEPHGELVAAGGYDVWLDELALDSSRIGCAD